MYVAQTTLILRILELIHPFCYIYIGPKKLTQSATVAVIKLKIPELNGSSEVNKSAGKETPSRSLRERKTVSPQNENGNISTSEDETDDGVIVRRQGKTRTVKQRAGSEVFISRETIFYGGSGALIIFTS